MRILFAGTPECAVPALRLLASRFNVCGILTNPPAPYGRTKKLKKSEIAEATETLKAENILPKEVPVFTPLKLDSEFRNEIIKLKPDILVCFAYGKIFGPKMMSIFPLGGLNIHPSLLPRWRGCAPIPSAICAGDRFTGVTIQTIAQKTDSGNIVAQSKIPIEKTDTTETMLKKCSELCCGMLSDVLINFNERIKNSVAQNENEASYSVQLKKEDGKIDWTKTADEIDCKIRAFTPWPGCFTYMNGEKINIIQAEPLSAANTENFLNRKCGSIAGVDRDAGILVVTGNGILAISILQKQTKNKLFWKDFLNGSPNFINGSFDS